VLRGASRPDLLRDESLADILAATARRRPQHPALIWGKRVVSYGELNAAGDALAGRCSGAARRRAGSLDYSCLAVRIC